MENKNYIWRPVSEYTGGRVLATNGLDVLIGEINSEGDCESEEDGSTILCGITGFIKIEEMLSELKESEDERIWKELIEYFRWNVQQILNNFDNKKVLTWLENQGKQNPADKVEPKFKVGKWYQCTKDFFGKGVTFDKNTAYYCAKEGCLQNEYGCHIAVAKDLYDNFKLWTIQDAKDGDVLTCYSEKKGQPIEQTGIIKQYVGRHGGCSNSFKAHFGVDWDNNVVIEGYMGSSNIYPSTKEQRDLLFQKMKEAGYEWDAEHKQINKIEQIKQKPAEWNKNDEVLLDETLHFIREFQQSDRCIDEGDMQNSVTCENWLKSLKDRVQPQPKQEWSEDVESAISLLKGMAEEQEKDYCPHNANHLRKAAQYLETFRPQSAWKPSDEQMQVLVWCMPLFVEPKLKGILESLINDLKKLREEEL